VTGVKDVRPASAASRTDLEEKSIVGRIRIETEKPIAYDSPDHIQPHGTAQNNTTQPRFNRKLGRLIPAPEVRLLDLGCAGGGLVKSILDDGGFAVGVEGSDYSRKIRRAEWATIPDHLFTADATVPFRLAEEVGPGRWEGLKFNVVTAWEFFEHIGEDGVAGVVDNILRHLAPGGFLLASIATYPDVVNGVVLHQTVHQKPWWVSTFARLGMQHQRDLENYFRFDMVNGEPHGPSFTIALSRRGEPLANHAGLRSLIRQDLPRETLRTVRWLSTPGAWKYIARQTKRRIESRLPGGRPYI
jgi:SAM-dependent methyltransferase